MKNLLILSIGFLIVFSCKKESNLAPPAEQPKLFDPVGNCLLTLEDYDGFKFRYTYDSIGRITKLRMGNLTFLYEYGPKIIVETSPNMIYESIHYLNDFGDVDSTVTQQGPTDMFYNKYIYDDKRQLLKYITKVEYEGGSSTYYKEYEWKNGDLVRSINHMSGLSDTSYFAFDLNKPNQFKASEEKRSFRKENTHQLIRSEFSDGFFEDITYIYDSLGKVIGQKIIDSEGVESGAAFIWTCP